MTTPTREPAEEANTALVQGRFHEIWSHENGDIATAANDRFRGAVLQLGDGGYEKALREYLNCEKQQQGAGRRIRPS